MKHRYHNAEACAVFTNVVTVVANVHLVALDSEIKISCNTQ